MVNDSQSIRRSELKNMTPEQAKTVLDASANMLNENANIRLQWTQLMYAFDPALDEKQKDAIDVYVNKLTETRSLSAQNIQLPSEPAALKKLTPEQRTLYDAYVASFQQAQNDYDRIAETLKAAGIDETRAEKFADNIFLAADSAFVNGQPIYQTGITYAIMRPAMGEAIYDALKQKNAGADGIATVALDINAYVGRFKPPSNGRVVDGTHATKGIPIKQADVIVDGYVVHAQMDNQGGAAFTISEVEDKSSGKRDMHPVAISARGSQVKIDDRGPMVFIADGPFTDAALADRVRRIV
ncbi:MAG: hypothetical protein K2X09_01815, partial [Rickettsiales bacterium]|nr:hypothetical protein [Rickettsiales bacterium]